MKGKFFKIMAALAAAAALMLPCAASAAEAEKPYAEGRILVKLARAGRHEGAARTLTARNAAGARIAGMTVAKSWDFFSPTANARTGGVSRSLASKSQEPATIALLTSETMTTEQMLAAAADEPSIEYAEPDYKIYPTALPNDPGVHEQWAYTNDEITSPAADGGHPGLDITEVWDEVLASGGTGEVVVAVVDMGVDYGHPDLAANMWNGENYGYPHNGWDSSQEKGSVTYFDPMDRDGHGTHVAGIIAALPNNDIGIAGAARNVKIIAAKVFGDSDGFSSAIVDTYNNLLELKQNGVNIVATNNSWKTTILSKTAGEAMEALGEAGVVNVVAAANDSADNDVTQGFPYNIRSKHSVVVAASTPWDEIAEFSNYGKRSVHIAAPGAWILSTFSRNAESQHAGDGDIKLKNSFVRELTATDKQHYYLDFKNTPEFSTRSDGTGRQSVSTENGWLEWKITAQSDGTFYLRLGAAIDLKSIKEREDIYLWTASISDQSFTLSLCSDDADGTHRYDSTVSGNFNHDGNFWRGNMLNIKDPYDEWEIEPSDGAKVWDSAEVYPELSISMSAGETRTVRIKDIAITKGKPYDKAAPYRYMDGTSMASPAVAGSLALVAAIHPEISPEELRARIIGGAVKIPSMKDKILTGGRLSVKKALNNPSPVINAVSAADGKLTLEGFFFGADGTLTLSADGGERTLEVMSWGENEITAELADAPSGFCEITVTRADGDWGRIIAEIAGEPSQWESLAPLPVPMHKASLAADEDNGAIYIAGCRSGDGMTPYFARYDIDSGEWRQLDDLPYEIYTSEDEGNSIRSSLGAALTVWNGKPVVLRNFGGDAVIAATYENGAWHSERITEEDIYRPNPASYEQALFAAPAKDGESLLLVMSSGSLWRVTPDEGKIEKLEAVPELSGRSLDGAMFATRNGTIAIFGGKGENAATPVFFDGESSWTGAPCPAPEEGEFSWTGAAFGYYGEFLVALEGTNNAAQSIGDGAYYDLDADEWRAEPTGRASIRNCGASVVVGDYIYRAAITDFFNGVTNEFERLSLKADAPEPLPDDPAQGGGSGGGCSSGFAALALLAAVPLIFARKRK